MTVVSYPEFCIPTLVFVVAILLYVQTSTTAMKGRKSNIQNGGPDLLDFSINTKFRTSYTECKYTS